MGQNLGVCEAVGFVFSKMLRSWQESSVRPSAGFDTGQSRLMYWGVQSRGWDSSHSCFSPSLETASRWVGQAGLALGKLLTRPLSAGVFRHIG